MIRRPIGDVLVTSDFAKSFRKLPKPIQSIAEKKDRQFRIDAHDSRLRVHKLKGALDGYWAYSITPQYRVLFRFLSSDKVVYYDIGTHEIYR